MTILYLEMVKLSLYNLIGHGFEIWSYECTEWIHMLRSYVRRLSEKNAELQLHHLVMDFQLFMNSKVLFKIVRKDSNLQKLKPVVVHIDYHPHKFYRMKAVVEYYVNGNQDALGSFPDGSHS